MTPNIQTDEELPARITAYLSGGGLFNPELADHAAVRDLLIECRAALAAQREAFALGAGQGRRYGTIRDAQNELTIDGTMDRTFNAILASASPDETRALLVGLAHKAVTCGHDVAMAWQIALQMAAQPASPVVAGKPKAENADGWQHLKAYGYAPGNYMSRCSTCGSTPVMDKRAITCRPCAEALYAGALAKQQAEQLCHCKDRKAGDCPGEWGPGCDLGNNPKHAKVYVMTPVEEAALGRALIRSVEVLPEKQAEPVAWRDHVEERIRGWRQRTMNRSGDHMAIDDFMDGESLEDLIDHVCDEYASPPSTAPASTAIPEGYVLVKTYSQCGEFADDSPGLRADCARKQSRGKPCERCPRKRAAPQQNKEQG